MITQLRYTCIDAIRLFYYGMLCVFMYPQGQFVEYNDEVRIPSLWDTFDMPTTPPKNIPNTQNLVYMMYIGFGFPPWPLYCFYDMLLVFPQTNVQLAIIIWCVCCVGALPSSAHTTIPSDLRLIYMPRRSASLFPVNEPFLLLIVVS